MSSSGENGPKRLLVTINNLLVPLMNAGASIPNKPNKTSAPITTSVKIETQAAEFQFKNGCKGNQVQKISQRNNSQIVGT